MATKQWAVVLALFSAGVLSACSSSSSSPDGPTEVTMSFVQSYDRWAQSGYTNPIPDSLYEAASDDMRKVLRDDQNWYLGGGVQQHGAVKIVNTELVELDDYQAVVRVTLDAAAVSVTAEGQETWVDYSQPIVTRFNLERTKSWRITSTESDE